MQTQAHIVSDGTLNPKHLIPTFLDELKELNLKEHDEIMHNYFEFYSPFIIYDPVWDTQEISWDDFVWNDGEHASYMLEALFNALENNAPEGTYFGASEGDGALYGFWSNDEPNDDWLESDYDDMFADRMEE